MKASVPMPAAALLALAPVVAAESQQVLLSREFSVAEAEALGAAIYRQDLASSRGSDLLIAEVPNPGEAGVLGWVTTGDAGGELVAFVGLDDGEFVSLYDARPGEANRRAFENARARDLSELELTMFLARMTATRQGGELCSSRFNTVVLSDPASDAWLVYLLAATEEPDLIPVGGHYRITVSSDGTEVLATDQLFASCLALDLAEELTADGFLPAELPLVQDVASVPLETSVFLNLLVGLDLAVTTAVDGREWIIRDGRILSPGIPVDRL